MQKGLVIRKGDNYWSILFLAVSTVQTFMYRRGSWNGTTTICEGSLNTKEELKTVIIIINHLIIIIIIINHHH